MNRRMPLIIILGVLIIAAGGGYWMYQNARSTNQTATTSSPETAPPPTATTASSPAPRSVVVIEEFGDYQCPPCGNLHPHLTAIKKDYGDRVRFVFHHFPLTTIHANANMAAEAAIAAGAQNKFWEMHNLLYENQKAWSELPDLQPVVTSFARTVGLDVNRFLADMRSPRTASTIASDVEQGMRRGVDSTPTIFIDGEKIPYENYGPTALRQEIDRRLTTK
ncbi:MAG: DsbA family protein [Acidobacteriota bacterium]